MGGDGGRARETWASQEQSLPSSPHFASRKRLGLVKDNSRGYLLRASYVTDSELDALHGICF